MGFPDNQKGEVGKQGGGRGDNTEKRIRENTGRGASRVISTTKGNQNSSKKREAQNGIFNIFVIFGRVGIHTRLGEGKVGNKILEHTNGTSPSTEETTNSGTGEEQETEDREGDGSSGDGVFEGIEATVDGRELSLGGPQIRDDNGFCIGGERGEGGKGGRGRGRGRG